MKPDPSDRDPPPGAFVSDGLAITMRGPLSPAERETLRAYWAEALGSAVDPGATIKRPLAPVLSSPTAPHTRRVVSTGTEGPAPDYRLLGVLGKGGMGVVHQARQGDLDRLVAVKMLLADLAHDPTARSKFRSEAVATGELQHPNIVPIYELGQTEDARLFYAMPQVRGQTWKPHDRNRKHLSIYSAV